MKTMVTKLFLNARIVTPHDEGYPLAGDKQGKVKTFNNGALLVSNGLVKAIGDRDDVLKAAEEETVNMEIDCENRLMIPGFVDPHTHLCFAARREEEFGLRLNGASYMEIHEKGGGILSSVRSVRETSEEELYTETLKNAVSALCHGTTTLEIKSGYGLDTQNELKMLRVIDSIGRDTPLDVVATFMGAHAVPEEYRNDPDAFIKMVEEEMLPAVSDQGIARFIDVFCEKGVFTIEQSRRILEAGRKWGLGLKIHADEVNDTGGAGLAAETGSVSAEHLLAAGEENLASMGHAGVIANILPGTAYSLKKPYADVRKMISLGVPVALATDCNPGSCFTESMPFIIGLAIMMMDMTPAEALVASTLNSAYAVRVADRAGSLQVNKQADFLIIDGESPAIFAYHAGVSPVKEVYKLGELVAQGE